jgi:hypothetical protein
LGNLQKFKMQYNDDWEILKQLIVDNTVFDESELTADQIKVSAQSPLEIKIEPSSSRSSSTSSTALSPKSSVSSSSLEEIIVCPYFLQGKCKFKGKCVLAHQIDECPYCLSKMPSGKLASSTHLGRCWKKFNSTKKGEVEYKRHCLQ